MKKKERLKTAKDQVNSTTNDSEGGSKKTGKEKSTEVATGFMSCIMYSHFSLLLALTGQ